MPSARQTRPNVPTLKILLVAFVAAAFPFAMAQAQAPDENAGATLQDVEQQLERKRVESERLKARATALKAELGSLGKNLVKAAAKVQAQESAVLELEEELYRLEAEARLKERQLADKQSQFSGVVMALTSISSTPSEALIVQPISTEDMVRSAILLRAAVPAIEHRAELLRNDLDALSFARSQVAARTADLELAMASLKDDETQLTKLVKRKQALRAEAISKRRVAESDMRKLGAKAKDLRDLMARLATTTVDDEDFTFGSITKARGRLPYPAIGGVIGLYGELLDGKLTAKGISIATRAGAQVISPFDGRVVFAGPFRGYGQLLIIDHGEGYHSLLAGLGRIEVTLGQPVLAGEPVAAMTNETSDKPVLYVELRRDNQPINPLPWLAAKKGNVSG